MNFTIDVIGVGAENALLPSGAAALARARRVAGSARLLASTALPEGVERIVLDGRLTERLAALPEGDLAVLASGDPLYYTAKRGEWQEDLGKRGNVRRKKLARRPAGKGLP